MANVNPLPHYGPVATDLSGVLDTFVRQPNDDSPSESNGKVSYRETWKGPYETAKELLSHIKTGDTITEIHKELQKTGKVQRYDVPECPSRGGISYEWTADSISIRELEAGAHAIVEIQYIGSDTSGGGGGGEGTYDPYQDVWSINWYAYTVTPWNFCANEYYSQANYSWSPSYDDQPPEGDWTKTANREYINNATTSPEWSVRGNSSDSFIVYSPDLENRNYRKYLPPACTAIYKKVALQRNAIYHYPVITHQTVKDKVVSSDISSVTFGNIGMGIDHVTSLSSCPYVFPSGWIWIKTGDEATQTKTKTNGGNKVTFIRKEQFQGVLSDHFDVNFYGNGKFSHDKDGILSGRWPLEGV